MPRLTITKRDVDRIAVTGSEQLFWDDRLSGFGLKVTAKGVKSYIVQYRTAGGRKGLTKRITIGRHGSPWTAEEARNEAKQLLATVAQGADPTGEKRRLREMLTVAELCDRYLVSGVGTKKASTLATDKGRIERHIKPLLGQRPVSEITQADLRRFMSLIADGKTAADVRTGPRGRAIVTGGKGTASRTLGLLGGVFTYAIELGLIKENPVRGIRRYADRRNERFLSNEELAKVGEGLRGAAEHGCNANAISILRILMFTGARRGEIERLRWSEVDLVGRRLHFDDSKTGQKSIPINRGALNILESQLKITGQEEYVFPATKGSGHYCGTPRVWANLRGKIGLENVRIHDLRHSFASIGAAGGTPLLVVGALLGHRNHGTTQRYAHLAENPVTTASEQIGVEIEKAMNALVVK